MIKKHFPAGLRDITTLGDYIGRQQNHAHRRFLETAKTLAQVRRLGLPAVQLNIADRQINIAEGCHGNP
jgi:hypothetical protein